MRDVTGLLKQLERLEQRLNPPIRISLWDILYGVVPMPDDIALIDQRHRQMLEALDALAVEGVTDALEATIAEAEKPLPNGLKFLEELPPCDGSSE